MNNPVGHVTTHGMGMDAKQGYVELHPFPEKKTVQVMVNQNDGTIVINGFWESLTKDASNQITLTFK